MEHPNYQRWKESQSHWDDEEFLKSLTPLMKLRYRRLDERVFGTLGPSLEGPSGRPILLDIGCGRGEFAFFLRERWKGKEDPWNYLGLEPSGEQLRQRDIPTLGLGFIRSSAERVPLQEMTVHGILIKEAIDHCYDPALVFREARRLLKPGGVLVVTVTNDRSYYKRLFPGKNRSLKAKQTDHLSFFGPEDLERLAREALFDRVSVETYNYLKLPRACERVLGMMGEAFELKVLEASDRIGRKWLPGQGGGIMLTAFRPRF